MGKCIIRETGFHLDKAELLIGSISSYYSYSAPITINKAHILLFRCAPDYFYVKFFTAFRSHGQEHILWP